MRRSSAFGLVALGLAVFVGRANAEAFGRFGYVPMRDFPGIEVSLAGFRARQESADRIKFFKPATQFRVVSTNDLEQVVVPVGAGGGIVKMRASLLSNTLDLYVQSSLRLRLSTPSSPYVTWAEGSVQNGVPTPPLRWFGLSFIDRQPPLAIGLPGKGGIVEVTGTQGNWVLNVTKVSGWVRIHLPVGLDPLGGASASVLGRLAKILREHEGYWASETPTLRAVDVRADADGVDATYRFSGPNAILPLYIQHAATGGYPLKTTVAWKALAGRDETGTRVYLPTSEFTARFPVRGFSPGRVIGLGQPKLAVGGSDLAGLIDGAMRLPLATTSFADRTAAEDAGGEYLGGVAMNLEPITGQMLPFDEQGNGLDRLAAHALTAQALRLGESAKSNGFLTSLRWRLDWSSGLLWAKDADTRRRASALASAAYAFGASPTERWTAAVLEAGLAAERGLAIARQRALGGDLPTFLEPMPDWRGVLFASSASPDPQAAAFLRLLRSPIRTTSDRILVAEDRGRGMALTWSADGAGVGSIDLIGQDATATPLTNLVEVRKIGERFLWRTEQAGTCEMLVQATLPPAWVAPPPYREVRR